MEELITDILLSASLCADCFAVALCSSVTMKKVTLAQVLKIALIFAIIQTSFLFVGWAFGDFIARYLMHFVKYKGGLFRGEAKKPYRLSEYRSCRSCRQYRRPGSRYFNVDGRTQSGRHDGPCRGRLHYYSPVCHHRHQGRKLDWNQSRQTCCRVRRCCPYIAGNQYIA